MVIGLILSHSRMGNAAFFNSLLISALLACGISPAFRTIGTYSLLISIILIDVYLLGSWFGLEQVVERMGNSSMTTETRDEVVKYALPMMRDYFWTGTGGGTFWYVFPNYAGEKGLSGYDHAHNDYVEIFSDLGIIGASCLAGVVLISLSQAITALKHRSSFVRGMGFASFMGTLSILIHSNVDFNLQIPANALLFITLLAIPTIALSINAPKNSY